MNRMIREAATKINNVVELAIAAKHDEEYLDRLALVNRIPAPVSACNYEGKYHTFVNKSLRSAYFLSRRVPYQLEAGYMYIPEDLHGYADNTQRLCGNYNELYCHGITCEECGNYTYRLNYANKSKKVSFNGMLIPECMTDERHMRCAHCVWCNSSGVAKYPRKCQITMEIFR